MDIGMVVMLYKDSARRQGMTRYYWTGERWTKDREKGKRYRGGPKTGAEAKRLKALGYARVVGIRVGYTD